MKKSNKPGSETHHNGNVKEVAVPAKPNLAAEQPAASKKPVTKTKAKPGTKGSTSASKDVKLVCRYCGSDDLAPSFIKRRDARCRACFKQRYSSAARHKSKTQFAA